jgi:hypothetical protein
MKSNHFRKKGSLSLTSIEFILNIVAVVIILVVVVALVNNSSAISTYSANEHYILELNYVLFSERGIMPDRFTFDTSTVKQRLDSMSINDIGIKMTLDDGREYYLNQIFFDRYYQRKSFDNYVYGNDDKPILLVDGNARKASVVKLEYIFRAEEAPTAVNKNS